MHGHTGQHQDNSGGQSQEAGEKQARAFIVVFVGRNAKGRASQPSRFRIS